MPPILVAGVRRTCVLTSGIPSAILSVTSGGAPTTLWVLERLLMLAAATPLHVPLCLLYHSLIDRSQAIAVYYKPRSSGPQG